MGISNESMRFAVVLLAFAMAANAHWTHDESLAQEIGPPPGEDEDMDVASLSDELVSTSEKATTAADKTYRVTFGTKAGSDTGSTAMFKVALGGADGLQPGLPPRYYQGVFMSYEDAETMAPPLKLGMTAIIDKTGACGGKFDTSTGQPVVCPHIRDATICEPNSKECMANLAKVGYNPGMMTIECNDENCRSLNAVGIIQRGQVKMADVGEITEVTVTDATDFSAANTCMNGNPVKYTCSHPWTPAFIKINTNDPKTGIGNGVYYITPEDGMKVGWNYAEPNTEEETVLKARPRDPDTESGLPADKSYNAILEKCMAETCEEEMDTKWGI